jgi:callose synthase
LRFGIAAILDIAFTWKVRQTLDFSAKVKHIMKLGVAMIWTIILPVYYANSRRKYTCYPATYGSWLQEWCFSSFMVAVAIYLMTNGVEMVLFLVPSVRKYMEISNHRICTILSWWTQVCSSCILPIGSEYF